MQVQLEASRQEKSELLRRIKRVKDVAKETQEKSGAMYVCPSLSRNVLTPPPQFGGPGKIHQVSEGRRGLLVWTGA
jgi:hypothetical protein